MLGMAALEPVPDAQPAPRTGLSGAMSSTKQAPASLLCVGIACLDIVVDVPQFPSEDVEMRAQGHRQARGGNAANTAAVAAELLPPSSSSEVAFCGVLVDPAVDAGSSFLLDDLKSCGVLPLPSLVESGATPTSYIIANASNASRTILHVRDIPELTCSAFERATHAWLKTRVGPLWVHFEGRHAAETLGMLRAVRDPAPLHATLGPRRLLPRASGATCSVEVEKVRAQHGASGSTGPSELALLPHADVVFSCREYARQQGLDTAVHLVQLLLTAAGCTDEQPAWPEVTVTWGAAGAFITLPPAQTETVPAARLTRSSGSQEWRAAAAGEPALVHVLHVPAPHVPTVVDTVGAGDTFIAGMLRALTHEPLPDALSAVQQAVALASAKVSQQGFKGLPWPPTASEALAAP